VQANDKALETYMHEKEVLPEHIRKELAVKKSTNTPWWWAIGVYLKVTELHRPCDATLWIVDAV
jgi:hypothetical protein